jgi:hypothetical protein
VLRLHAERIAAVTELGADRLPRRQLGDRSGAVMLAQRSLATIVDRERGHSPHYGITPCGQPTANGDGIDSSIVPFGSSVTAWNANACATCIAAGIGPFHW